MKVISIFMKVKERNAFKKKILSYIQDKFPKFKGEVTSDREGIIFTLIIKNESLSKSFRKEATQLIFDCDEVGAINKEDIVLGVKHWNKIMETL